jgi:hypothetical protein
MGLTASPLLRQYRTFQIHHYANSGFENSSNSRARAFEGAERAFEVWLASVRMTKLRLSPTTMHAEIVRGWNTIFCVH